MNLISNTIDTSVTSPMMREYEEIKKRLTAKAQAAVKRGDREAVRIANADLQDHILSKDKYRESARKQLSIFDL